MCFSRRSSVLESRTRFLLQDLPDAVGARNDFLACRDQAAHEDKLRCAPNDFRLAGDELSQLRGRDELNLQLRGGAVRMTQRIDNAAPEVPIWLA